MNFDLIGAYTSDNLSLKAAVTECFNVLYEIDCLPHLSSKNSKITHCVRQVYETTTMYKINAYKKECLSLIDV